MHIAYLINLYPTVSHTFIRREIRALEAQGVHVERLALRGWDSELVDPLDTEELSRTRHTLRHGIAPLLWNALRFGCKNPAIMWEGLKLALSMSKKGARSWPFHLIYLAHACQIITWLEGTEVTHLHAHFGTNSTEIAALVQALGGPGYSFTIHGSEMHNTPSQHAFPQKLDHAKFAAACCAYIGSQLMYNTPSTLWKKVHTVHCGLAPSAFEAAPAALPVHPVFLSVGRLSPEKGHLLLLEAFAELLKTHPDAQLVLAGDGPMRGEIEERISVLGLKKAVRITGWVTSDQVREELRAARALVHPSFAEGLPVVIMEAMAERRPVISTYVGGIPELVLSGETGWLVPAGQVSALTNALKQCSALPDDALRRMGEASYTRVHARHDAATEAAKLLALFKDHMAT